MSAPPGNLGPRHRRHVQGVAVSDDIEYHDRMSDADALMWHIEKDPALRSTITTLFVFDGKLDRARLERRIERLSRVVPRLRQRVRSNSLSLAPPRWETDPNFDLGFHLWWVKAPGRGELREVLDMAEPIAMSGFDRARPLWRAVAVEGLKGGRSAIIMKVHHAVTDGVGGVRIMLELMDMEPDAADKKMPGRPEVHVMTQPERFADALDHERRRQLGMVKRSAGVGLSSIVSAVSDPAGTLNAAGDLAASLGRTLRPVAHPMSPLMTGRSLSYRFDTLTIPLDTAKKAARKAGGTLNDAFVGGVARGLRIYHLRHGIDCDELRMGIPINIRSVENENLAGNAFIPARLEVPIDADDPIVLMKEIHSLVDGARTEPANDLVEPMSNLLNRLPTTALTGLFGSMMKGLDFTTSNVPGAPFPVYLAGTPLVAQFPFGPLSGAATNITLLSYQNDLNIGVNSDPAAIPDPEVLIASLEEGFADVLALAD